MTLRRIAEIAGMPMPTRSAACFSSSSRAAGKSPGRIQLSVRSVLEKPASAISRNTPSHTEASASFTWPPEGPVGANCSRAALIGQSSAV
jgi:hypothetical protein